MPHDAREPKSMDAIMALCKRRGFIYQASEIYGGINGFWDYGPLGAQLKKNLRDAWWDDVVMNPCRGRSGPGGQNVEIVPLDTCIIQHPKVWEASGHAAGFHDPMVSCRAEGCKGLFRADQLYQAELFPVGVVPQSGASTAAEVLQRAAPQAAFRVVCFENEPVAEARACLKAVSGARRVQYRLVRGSDESVLHFFELDGRPYLWKRSATSAGLREGDPCPRCGGPLTAPRQFSLMFRTYVGALEDASAQVWLRPETAQGIFVQFRNVLDTTRVKVPFGIAQVGKAFRNEITPRHFTFRSREFEQMEIEFFCHESQAMEWYAFWCQWRLEWWRSLGLSGDNLRLREHAPEELAHYSKATSDIEYRFPFTAPDFGELEGVAYRGCFDLEQHQTHSGQRLDYFDPQRQERYLPHVVEPSAGLDRGVLAVICEAYTRDESRPSPEILRFHPRLAPIKAAVFPLVNKDGMPEVAARLHADLSRRFARVGFIETDVRQSIGKRYARMDEAGCPFCFTVDGQTLADQTVTVRDRDTGRQERIAMDHAARYLSERLGL